MTFPSPKLAQQYQAALALAAKCAPGQNVSKVFCTDDKYEVKLDLNPGNFAPEEITVKAVDGYVVVEGKHETSSEKLGIMSFQFSRRYVLPEGVEPESLTCSLNPEGVLTLRAPRRKKESPREKVIPVEKEDSNNNSQVGSPKKEN